MNIQEKSFFGIIISILLALSVVIPLIVVRSVEKKTSIVPKKTGPDYYLDEYMNLATFNAYISNFAAVNEYFYKLSSLGKTANNNSIHNIILEGSAHRPIILIVAGIMGNDWRSVLIVLHVLNKMSWTFCRNTPFHSFSFHFIPLLNPDGYAHSMSLPNKAWWVKNYNAKRSRKGLKGVNIFYNFDSNWIQHDEKDSRFGGAHPFSEDESKLFRDYFLQNRERIEAIFLMFSPQNKKFKNDRFITLPETGVNSTEKWKLWEELIKRTMFILQAKTSFSYVQSRQLKEGQNGRMDNWILDTTKNVKVANFQMDFVRGAGEDTDKLIKALGEDFAELINKITTALAAQRLKSG